MIEMRLTSYLVALILVLGLFSTPLTSANCSSYTFTKIADSGGSFDSFGDSSINNDGTVAFGAFLDNGLQGIFTGSGGAITTIADTSNPSLLSFGDPDINNSGKVAFRATLD